DPELDALNSSNGDYHGANETLGRNGGASTDDAFSFATGTGITLETSTSLNKTVLQKSGATIAIFDTTTIPGELRVTFTNSNGQTPTSADVDYILQQITYANSSDTPPATAQIDWTFDDGNTGSQGTGGALQATGSTTVTITAVNDAPTFDEPNFSEHIVTSSATDAHSVTAADIDGDGDMDLVSAWYDGGGNTVSWYENNGSEIFAEHIISSSAGGAKGIQAVDMDSDGDLDVLTALSDDGTITWYENDGSENFTERTSNNSLEQSAYAIDVDADGDLDIVAGGGSTVAWLENDGNENFTQRTVATDMAGNRSVYATDVDGDGDIDLLAGSRDTDTVKWYENDGSENFTAHTITSSADGVIKVYATDMDGDGDMDVLSASKDDDTIAWYENDGSETFTKHTISNTMASAKQVYATDMDGDGDVDVLASSQDNNKVAWYENDGSENFAEHTVTTSAIAAVGVYAADVDGDGDMDILSASKNDSTIAWYENTAVTTLDGAPTFIEGGTAVVLDVDVDISDSELDALNGGLGNYDGASLTLVRNTGADAEDVFSNDSLLGILTEGQTFAYDGTTIGTVTTNSAGTLVLTFNSNATSALVDSTLQSIAYANSSDAPPASVQIDWSFDDGDAGVPLQATGSTTVTITAVNDAPVLSGSNNLTDITEDAFTNSGTLISALIAGHITDVDSGASEGIAVTGVDNSNGTWEYSINGGTNWNTLGSPSDMNARLLADDASTRVRFVPNADYFGTVAGGITFRAWDQTAGTHGDEVNLSGTDSASDGFSTVSYSNNDGTTNWTSSWIEDDGEGGGA
ncbi:MAG: VCBS repeat-containing protein, partial [Gammaproteobacteria bacterium]|nr:VCBS repeat-containing protein [Gammaproteobacteria bacterium]